MITMRGWGVASLVGCKAFAISGGSISPQDIKLFPCLFGAWLLLWNAKLLCCVAGLLHPRT